MTAIVQRRNGTKGSSIVEFAMSVIVLLIVIFGLINFFLAFYAYQFVTYAARAGARYAIVRGSACSGLNNCDATAAQIQTYIKSLNLPGIDPALITMNTTNSFVGPDTAPAATAGCTSVAGVYNSPGCPVQIRVQYTFPSILPFLRVGTIPLTATSEMQISQ
jgi:Flp pilus assembly protein TadG